MKWRPAQGIVAPIVQLARGGLRRAWRERASWRTAIGAFTLIELLVTVGVIAILAALLLPVLGKVKAQGRGAACLSNLRQVGLALQMYAEENENRLPVMYDALFGTNNPAGLNRATMDRVLSNHLGNPMVLQCPADDRLIFEQTRSSYSWNVLVNGQMADQLRVMNLNVDNDSIPLAFDKEDFHRARGEGKEMNYLYADGRIQNLLVMEGTVRRD